MLACAGSNDIIGRTKLDATAAFIAIEQESTKMGVSANEGKTNVWWYPLIGLLMVT